MATKLSWLPQFSLRSFLIAIAILGIGLGAVLSASEAWALTLAIAFNLLIPTAVVLAIVLLGRPRAFWIGVAVFGASCSLFFAEKFEFLSDRATDDVNGLIGTYVAPRIADLHEARITQDAEESLQRYLDRLGAGASPVTRMREAARSKARYDRGARSKVSHLATVSARRFLMILLALGGGCLASGAHRYQTHGVASTTGTGGEGGKASEI